MLYLGSNQERLAIEAQMCGSYRQRTRAHLLTLNHAFLRDLSGLRISGDVAVDASQSITRSLRMEIKDPVDILGLETNPSGFSAPNVMVQVWKDIYVDALNRWAEIPVFCGPITKPSRNGWTLSIEAQDKAALASYEALPVTVPRGQNAGLAIQQALNWAGETRFRVSTTTAITQQDYVIQGTDSTPLVVARQIAASLGWVLFWDAEGYAVARPLGGGPEFTFTTGRGGTLTSQVSTGYWDTETVNRLYVNGGVTGSKQISAMATLNVNHPLSPENLMRGGVPQSGLRIAHAEDQPGLATTGQAGRWVEAQLQEMAIQARTVSFDSRPVWHLQEHDYYRVADHIDAVYADARVTQMSVPLAHEGVQSNGYLRRTGFAAGARVSSGKTKTA